MSDSFRYRGYDIAPLSDGFRYRGCEIVPRQEWEGWCASIHPVRPDLPLSKRSILRTLAPRKEDALDEAKRDIDRLLSQLKSIKGRRPANS
jgi:hypothetical protein